MASTIRVVSAWEFPGYLTSLIELLQDAVDSGASVGFLPPLAAAEAREYWQEIGAALPSGSVLLLVAEEDGRLLGTVQLHLVRKTNAPHRAEVAKLLVHSTAQRRGIGRQLMQEVERVARQHQRTTLVLDTLRGAGSEVLYQSIGYVPAGAIPNYMCNEKGELCATVYYYKLLNQEAGL
ncbi:GNAT family N-acetyltransferase [Hymenobacter sp. HSC-4F20]|uniref:GNAT family N-acetyltransferase n=1 Tax=Hymenobacter sp. HSC-4F20 TaxID=2864135 RepID=UPI001C72EDE7|nr:GNAT family N-acetyltransferase [Hymenobacter sp. HSC-4F20]MBX0291341.1 GNAT family N-acetyltransferase [Hymenobacter sp. HSC-4F20]